MCSICCLSNTERIAVLLLLLVVVLVIIGSKFVRDDEYGYTLDEHSCLLTVVPLTIIDLTNLTTLRYTSPTMSTPLRSPLSGHLGSEVSATKKLN